VRMAAGTQYFLPEHFAVVRRTASGGANRFRDQRTVIPPAANDIANNARRDIRCRGRSEQKHRFDIGKLTVGVSDGYLKFKIRRRAQSPCHTAGVGWAARANREPLRAYSRHSWRMCKRECNKAPACFERKHGFFFGVNAYG